MSEIDKKPTMRQLPVDETSCRILQLLQEDGRISNLALAEKVGLSPTACLERTRRLERDGYIKQYSAILDPVKLRQRRIVMVHITLEKTTTEVLEAFHREVVKLKAVKSCFMVTGSCSYILKLRYDDIEDYSSYLAGVVMKLPGVSYSHTFVVMEVIKDRDDISFDL